MRLSADAKAYAASLAQRLSGPEETKRFTLEIAAEAFQHGYDHHKASQRRLEKLAKGKP